MAAKTTTKRDSSESSFDWRTICATSRLWGRPEPEKTGSFYHRSSCFAEDHLKTYMPQ